MLCLIQASTVLSGHTSAWLGIKEVWGLFGRLNFVKFPPIAEPSKNVSNAKLLTEKSKQTGLLSFLLIVIFYCIFFILYKINKKPHMPHSQLPCYLLEK
jgi:hypothetical protein